MSETQAGRRPDADVCFVIPTYNEASNVTPLLRRLTELYRSPDTVFLLIDDDSPDRTSDLIRACARSDGRIRLLVGSRRGFGEAYVRGMRHALETLGAGVVVQMDADFSHDPADAARLLAWIERGADVAIGSRYAAGGAVDRQWPVWRRWLSRWGNRMVRSVAGLRGVADCTSGFKAIRASTLAAVMATGIRVRGHVFQVVLLHRLLQSGARVVEEPIRFHDRERGRTKLGVGGMLEFFYAVCRLRFARGLPVVISNSEMSLKPGGDPRLSGDRTDGPKRGSARAALRTARPGDYRSSSCE